MRDPADLLGELARLSLAAAAIEAEWKERLRELDLLRKLEREVRQRRLAVTLALERSAAGPKPH